ncbi:hypothetical protein X975_14533, partial [Stegodyphus mimosarum]
MQFQHLVEDQQMHPPTGQGFQVKADFVGGPLHENRN